MLVAVYGVGTAFFMPAFEAILPELLPKSDLPAANALDQFVRPIAMRLIGPVAGGALVAASAGLAFAIDAASFAACLVAVLVMPRRSRRNVEVRRPASQRSRRGSASFASACGCGARFSPRRSLTSCSSAPPKCCFPIS